MNKGTPAIIAGYLVLITVVVMSVAVRFVNAELTETQLFIKYWYLWLMCFPVIYIGGNLINTGSKINNNERRNHE